MGTPEVDEMQPQNMLGPHPLRIACACTTRLVQLTKHAFLHHSMLTTPSTSVMHLLHASRLSCPLRNLLLMQSAGAHQDCVRNVFRDNAQHDCKGECSYKPARMQSAFEQATHLCPALFLPGPQHLHRVLGGHQGQGMRQCKPYCVRYSHALLSSVLACMRHATLTNPKAPGCHHSTFMTLAVSALTSPRTVHPADGARHRVASCQRPL